MKASAATAAPIPMPALASALRPGCVLAFDAFAAGEDLAVGGIKVTEMEVTIMEGDRTDVVVFVCFIIMLVGGVMEVIDVVLEVVDVVMEVVDVVLEVIQVLDLVDVVLRPTAVAGLAISSYPDIGKAPQVLELGPVASWTSK